MLFSNSCIKVEDATWFLDSPLVVLTVPYLQHENPTPVPLLPALPSHLIFSMTKQVVKAKEVPREVKASKTASPRSWALPGSREWRTRHTKEETETKPLTSKTEHMVSLLHGVRGAVVFRRLDFKEGRVFCLWEYREKATNEDDVQQYVLSTDIDKECRLIDRSLPKREDIERSVKISVGQRDVACVVRSGLG